MMRVDLTTGELRLGGHHIDALLRGLGSPFAPADAELTADDLVELDGAWQELVAAGVVGADAAPAAGFGARLAALVVPWLVVQVRVFGAVGNEGHRLWISPAEGLAVAEVEPGWYDLIPVAPDGAAGALARLCRLGPRDHPGELVHQIPASVLAELYGADGASGLARHLAIWPEIAGQVLEGNWRILDIETAWYPGLYDDPADAERAAKAMLLLDTPAGLLTLEPTDAAVMVRGVIPADVWEMLISITRLPADVQLDRVRIGRES